MRPNCKGCEFEFDDAYHYQEDGLYLATTIDLPSSYPVNKGHFFMIMVDDKGKAIIR